MPTLTVRNAQRALPVDVVKLQRFARAALEECLRLPRVPTSLAELDALTIILVSDTRMAKLHRQYLGEYEPTDVITFHEGDIFISTETARRNATKFRTTFRHELQLYVVHGFLHLARYDDRTPSSAQRMSGLQERICAATIARLAGEGARGLK